MSRTSTARPQRRYDHRLRDLVCTSQSLELAARHGVPRSTARGWLAPTAQPVVTLDALNQDVVRLRREFVTYYHGERPHQGLDNRLPGARRPRGPPPKCPGRIDDQVVPLHQVSCQQRLGGLLKSYSRAA